MAKMKYKMSSRATILLGRESVSRVDGAIIELVKTHTMQMQVFAVSALM